MVLFKVAPVEWRPLLITEILDGGAVKGILFYGGQVDRQCSWIRRHVWTPTDEVPYFLIRKSFQGEEEGQWRPIPLVGSTQ